jgi:hypothetical protein
MAIRWQILGAAAFAIWILFRNLPAALTFLWPGLLRAQETDDDGSLDPEREPAMERVDKELRELGFGKIGAIQVRPPLSSGWADLVFAAPALRAFADVGVRAGAVAVTLFTPFAGGEAVMTSDFKRATSERRDFLAGGIPGADVPGLWAVHRRRVEHFKPGGSAPQAWDDFSIAGRVRADEVVYHGPGKRELRGRAMASAVVALFAFVLLAMSALQLVKTLPRG